VRQKPRSEDEKDSRDGKDVKEMSDVTKAGILPPLSSWQSLMSVQ
jgi:hypothetical protein